MDPRDFPRNLRNNATPEEHAVWQALSRLRPRFTRQLRLYPFVADFACRRARMVVEIDGSQHAENAGDEDRTSELGENGWLVLRFWNSDVEANLDGVIEAIIKAGNPRLPPGEAFAFVPSRAGRDRKPRSRK